MKVAIVNPIQRHFSGGYFKYLGELAPRLAADARVRELTVWLPEGAAAPPLPPELVRRWTGGVARAGLRELRTHVRQAGADVVFIPTARHLDFDGTPTVVMVRNMEPLERPLAGNDLGEGLRNLGRAAVARRACRRASRVIAVSQHVQTYLQQRWGVPANKVGVVYHGISAPTVLPATIPDALRSVAGTPFIFTAGSLRAARGLEDLVAAAPEILERNPELRIVVAGRWDPGSTRYRKTLMDLVARLGLADRTVWAGQLDPDAMAWCFAHCELFVMTSRAEACPNTALEALSHGCVIASTSTPPMPEFLADAAVYYTPDSAAELSRAARSLLMATPDARDQHRARAVERSRFFAWPATASSTVDELFHVVTSRVPQQDIS